MRLTIPGVMHLMNGETITTVCGRTGVNACNVVFEVTCPECLKKIKQQHPIAVPTRSKKAKVKVISHNKSIGLGF